MSSPRPSPPSKEFTKHDPQASLSLGPTGFRRASKTNGRILPQSPSCCRHHCGFQAAENEHGDNGDNSDDDNDDDDEERDGTMLVTITINDKNSDDHENNRDESSDSDNDNDDDDHHHMMRMMTR